MMWVSPTIGRSWPGKYDGTDDLLAKLVELGMFLQIQVHGTQLLDLLPMLERSRVRLLIDHYSRPVPQAGLQQPALQALLASGRTGRAAVKLSGYSRISQQSYPFEDMWPYVQALVEAFMLDNCLWALTGRSSTRPSGSITCCY